MTTLQSQSSRDIFLKYDRMSKEELDKVKNENDGQKISYEDQTQLMCNHMGQVMKLARKYYKIVITNQWMYTSPAFEYQDLVQCGMLGLIKAMNRYDVNHPKQATFNTYAYWYIRVEIQRHIQDNGQFVRVPVWTQGDMDKIINIVPFTKENQTFIEFLSHEFASGKAIERALNIAALAFFEDEVPEILQNQTLNRSTMTDATKDFEILCDRYGLCGRQKLTLKECE